MKSVVTAKKTVLICHYRVGWTDGVSLEIDKRVDVLKEAGWNVYLLAGPNSKGADYVIDELNFDLPEIRKITDNAFSELKDFRSEADLLKEIGKVSDLFSIKLNRILDELNPDFILLHNIFSHGRNIPCAKSFYEVLKKRNIPALATHHDFYWEREHLKEPVGREIQKYMDQYVPPVLPRLKHAVINSIAGTELLSKTGIESFIIPDTLDFQIAPWLKDSFNSTLPSDFSMNEDDIFILQATRIVKRKGIELIPPIIKRLNEPEYLNRLKGKILYNGKMVKEDSRFVFLLAGYAEDEALTYLDSLKKMMADQNIPHYFLGSKVAAERNEAGGLKKYSLFDTYPYADIVSFPSQVEGWGNQFLEAVFAKKPVLVFEYSVFIKDIKDEGYKFISLGNKVQTDKKSGLIKLSDNKIDQVCNEVIETLLSEDIMSDLNNNYDLAEKNNSRKSLSKLMTIAMEHYED